jgi:hypothetical protein
VQQNEKNVWRLLYLEILGIHEPGALGVKQAENIRDAPDIRPFWISGIRPDTSFDLPDIPLFWIYGIRPDTSFDLPDIRLFKISGIRLDTEF